MFGYQRHFLQLHHCTLSSQRGRKQWGHDSLSILLSQKRASTTFCFFAKFLPSHLHAVSSRTLLRDHRKPNLLKHCATKPSIMVTRDDGRMGGDGQREAIIIDAKSSPDHKRGADSPRQSMQPVDAADGENDSQRPVQPTRYISLLTMLTVQYQSCYLMANVG